ncbi:MAG: sugar ABC transporter ATP-binding protein, partial [Candidatus Marinimicrobia bacterium]|nr:sugar ABC transporter ATP-binding protein [Candidatus Neomarinimicrobiota bacterium]
MPAATPRLEMQGITKRFGATLALEEVDFSVGAGEIHALVGENGAGKSTLVKILSGAHQPDGGAMTLDGKPFQPRNPLDARRQHVGMIYQELSLAPHLTVEENILLGMEPHRYGWIRWREVRDRALEALAQFDRPEIRPDMKVGDLSLSAQQLVEIGRSLAVGCRVLILDEPTSSLSHEDIERLFEIIRRLKGQGLSIIYISHFLEEVQAIADRLTVLRDGAVVGTSEVGDLTPHEIVALMVGHEVSELYPRSNREAQAPILEIKDLGGMQKPQSASLTLHRGEVLGIFGLIGAGRTELLRAIFGLDPVRRGQIKIGVHLGPRSPMQRWLRGRGMLREERKAEGLALTLSIADKVTSSKLTGFGPLGLVLPQRQHTATDKWIKRLAIRATHPGQRVGDLSGGNQQKVALARLLQHDVDVLLLDEPTRGIDVAAKAKIYQVIDDLASASAGDGQPRKATIRI